MNAIEMKNSPSKNDEKQVQTPIEETKEGHIH